MSAQNIRDDRVSAEETRSVGRWPPEQEREATLMAHRASLYQWCCKLLEDQEDAQDAAQEVMRLACERWESFRGESSPARWLYQIARNYCFNRRRDKERQTISLDGPNAPLVAAPPDAPGSMPNVEQHILHDQLLNAVMTEAKTRKPPWDALDHLIFRAYYGGEKRSWVEVAALVNRQVDTVKDRYRRHIEPTFAAVRRKNQW